MYDPNEPEAQRYLRGAMTDAEKSHFEFRLSHDQNLRDELTRASAERWGAERPTPGYRDEVRHRLSTPPRRLRQAARFWGGLASGVAAVLLTFFAAGNLLTPPAVSPSASAEPDMVFTTDYDTGDFPVLAQSWWHTLGVHPLQSIYDDEMIQLNRKTRRLTDLDAIDVSPMGLPWQPFQP